MTKRTSPAVPSLKTMSLFDTLNQIDSTDQQATKKRKTVASSTLAKSKAARTQSNLHSTLISIRILLQKSLTSPNEIPSEDIQNCLEKLVAARRTLIGATISSDNDETNEDTLKNNTMDWDSTTLEKEYSTCRNYWKKTLNKKEHDLRLHAGLTIKSHQKFKSVDISFWDRVEGATAAEERLSSSTIPSSSSSITPSDLYDDSKLYRDMLKDFVTTADTSAAAERVKAAETKKRKKKKLSKEVDRKASKGRKVRFTVHPKLTNFCFPVQRPTPIIEADDWFRSLFGGVAGRSK